MHLYVIFYHDTGRSYFCLFQAYTVMSQMKYLHRNVIITRPHYFAYKIKACIDLQGMHVPSNT